MENAQDSTREEEQPTTPPTEYRALIQMTRPLMVVKDAALPPGLPICRDQAIWPRTLSPDAEPTLEGGEILSIEAPWTATTADPELPDTLGGPAARTTPEVEQGTAVDSESDLTFRIYLGMS